MLCMGFHLLSGNTKVDPKSLFPEGERERGGERESEVRTLRIHVMSYEEGDTCHMRKRIHVI
jgi:hypothetical protein